MCCQGSLGSWGTGPSAGAADEGTGSSAAAACPEARTAALGVCLQRQGRHQQDESPSGAAAMPCTPKPGPGSHAGPCTRRCRAQHTAVFAPVGYIKHSVFPGSQGAPQAARPTGKPPARQNEQTEHSLLQNSRVARLGGGCHYSGINEDEPEEHIY